MMNAKFSERSTSDLIALRDRASAAYYGSGGTVLSDEAFDKLTAELAARGVEEQVGHGSSGGKVSHARRMLSLRKVHDVADLEALIAEHPGAAYTVEPKFDGLSASVRYNKAGRLSLALTRGDGEKGDDITRAIKAIFDVQGLPLQLTAVDEATGNSAGEVRGEIVMLRSAFTRLNEERTAADEKPLVNPRNASAGLIARVARNVEALRSEEKGTISHTRRQQAVEDAVAAAGRWLTFIPFDGDGAVRLTARSSEFLFPGARGLGDRRIGLRETDPFAPFPHYLLPASPFRAVGQEIIHPVSWLDTHADHLDVDTDGVVVKFSDPELRAELGESSTAPRWALAYKYPNRPKQTILRAVEWAETRTGRVVPTAVFDPVELAGATVSRATLNNAAFLEELDVWIGDTIEVTRANEVIPNVVGRVGEHATDAVPVPDPNGWPVGVRLPHSTNFTTRDRFVVVTYPTPDTHHDVKLVAIFGGDRERRNEIDDDEYFDFEAYVHNPDGDDSCVTVHSVFEPPAVADAVMAWMRHRLVTWQSDLIYRREGRDFVHDGGRDPVKDITFAASKLDILGLGEDVVRRLIAGNPQIDSFPALLEACRAGGLVPFERGTQKLVDKLTAEVLVKTSGPQDPAKWIAAAGVPTIGRRLSKKILAGLIESENPGVNRIPRIPFTIMNWASPDTIRGIDGCGDAVAEKVENSGEVWALWGRINDIKWDWTKYERPALGSIADAIASLNEPEIDPGSSFPPPPSAEAPLSGKRVLITGTLPTLSRKEAEARIEELGGAVASSVSKNLDLLVAGEKAGSKLAKAEALGIKIMTGDEFEGMNA